MSKFMEVNQKIAETVAEGMQKIEDGVVKGYKGIENGVVEGFTKVTDKMVETFLTKEGESVEDAKKRMAQEQADREAASKAILEKNQAATEKHVADAKAKANVPEVKIPEVKINK